MMENGFLKGMCSPKTPFSDPVPARHYINVFEGEIDCPAEMPEEVGARTSAILEHAFSVFNINHPAGYCGRSLSVGDVVKLGEEYYMCMAIGFRKVKFEA